MSCNPASQVSDSKNEISETQPVPPKAARIVSLDALRGFDIFLLLFLSIYGAFHNGPLAPVVDTSPFWQAVTWQMNHRGWHEGFSLCDLIMPLFLFMTGATIPLSLAKYVKGDQKPTWKLARRIMRRVLCLWVLGMTIQGNLLALVPSEFKIYSNTLQAIAAGYLISCCVYLFLPRWAQWVTFFGLLFAFWASLTWIKFGEYGGGSFTGNGNLAYGIDIAVLGRFRNITSVNEMGQVIFNPGYTYTWVFSSLTFGATSLSGMFAGEWLRAAHQKEKSPDMTPAQVRRSQWSTFSLLLVTGLVSVVAGWLWDKVPEGTFGYCPLIKYIWTPSMVLYSSGWSLLLLALFFLYFDLAKWTLFKTFFVVLGVNAITAYILSHLLHFDQIADWLLYGLAQYTGVWQGPILAIAGFGILWYLLYAMYRCGKFLRV